jgi:hypothetical protein
MDFFNLSPNMNIKGVLGFLILLCLALAIDKKDVYDIGSKFKIACNGNKIAIALKPLRIFSLSLVTSHIAANTEIKVLTNTS